MMGRETRAARAAGLTLGALLALAACQKPAPPAANAAANAAAPANVISGASGASAKDAADVTAFLQALYDHYKTSKDNNFQMFDKDAPEVFSADFIRLIAADEKVLNGDVGVIDGDWLCSCQDFVSLKATIAVQSATPTTARATSDFVDTGIPDQGTRHVNFKLVKENGHWRIDDIQTAGEAWLRTQLEDEIKTQSKPGKKPSGDGAD